MLFSRKPISRSMMGLFSADYSGIHVIIVRILMSLVSHIYFLYICLFTMLVQLTIFFFEFSLNLKVLVEIGHIIFLIGSLKRFLEELCLLTVHSEYLPMAHVNPAVDLII